MIKYVKQPTSKSCGQSVLAMAANISAEESIKLYGHSTTTKLYEHKKILDKLGISYGEATKIDNRKKFVLPNKAFLRINIPNRKTGHLTLYYKGKVYDPTSGIFDSAKEFIEHYRENYNRRYRIDWYMEIE